MRLRIHCLLLAFVVANCSRPVNGESLVIESDGSTTAAALGPGNPSAAVLTRLDTGDISGLTFSPVAVGGFGSNTPVPLGAPAGTTLINIAPGDGQNGFFAVNFTLPPHF